VNIYVKPVESAHCCNHCGESHYGESCPRVYMAIQEFPPGKYETYSVWLKFMLNVQPQAVKKYNLFRGK
jgi:hypothetical protein